MEGASHIGAPAPRRRGPTARRPSSPTSVARVPVELPADEGSPPAAATSTSADTPTPVLDCVPQEVGDVAALLDCLTGVVDDLKREPRALSLTPLALGGFGEMLAACPAALSAPRVLTALRSYVGRVADATARFDAATNAARLALAAARRVCGDVEADPQDTARACDALHRAANAAVVAARGVAATAKDLLEELQLGTNDALVDAAALARGEALRRLLLPPSGRNVPRDGHDHGARRRRLLDFVEESFDAAEDMPPPALRAPAPSSLAWCPSAEQCGGPWASSGGGIAWLLLLLAAHPRTRDAGLTVRASLRAAQAFADEHVLAAALASPVDESQEQLDVRTRLANLDACRSLALAAAAVARGAVGPSPRPSVRLGIVAVLVGVHNECVLHRLPTSFAARVRAALMTRFGTLVLGELQCMIARWMARHHSRLPADLRDFFDPCISVVLSGRGGTELFGGQAV